MTTADLAAAFWEAYLADPDSDRTWELFNVLDRRADWRGALSLGDLVEDLENAAPGAGGLARRLRRGAGHRCRADRGRRRHHRPSTAGGSLMART